MKEMIPVIAAFVAGIFAVVSAVIAWRLKNTSDERTRLAALDKEKREEIKRLYTDIFVLFEQALKQIWTKEAFTLGREFSETNARVRLLAPQKIADQYEIVGSLLREWSRLHYKATPQQWREGEKIVTIIQSPDPTEEYREPARIAHEKLQEELRKLIELMRVALDGGS